MYAPLYLPPVTFTRNAPILLAHTAVLATLGTLVTGKHAQVRKLDRIMLLGNRVRAKIQNKFKVRKRKNCTLSIKNKCLRAGCIWNWADDKSLLIPISSFHLFCSQNFFVT